ncbi:MAG: hypothetical protein ACW98D_21330 [Promethearchaeota archaeon]|jgi:hypothetical protein
MAKTNKRLTEELDFLLQKNEKFHVQIDYLKKESDQLKRDMRFLTECMLDEKSFTEDVVRKLKKILFWTKQKT